MVDYVGNALVPPTQRRVNNGLYTTDRELLASTSGFTQRGCTLGGGQGIIPLGTVMGRVTATKKWAPYASGASDGTQVARGVLRTTVDTGTGASSVDVQANIVIMGQLTWSLMSGADATAITSLGGRYDTVLDTFTM